MNSPIRRVLLIGMMGAGKSTTGREVAARLGWPFLDSDAEIERITGKTVPEIWMSAGEPAFRAEESRVLAEAVTSEGPVVVAVAGGAVLDAGNRRRIKQAGLVVWLRAEVTTLTRRVGSGAGRPLLTGGPGAAIPALEAERRPLYTELADAVVDVDGRRPGEVVDEVMHAVTNAARKASPCA